MYFITVSEMLGTKGDVIARKVSEELKYSFFGEEELLAVAAEMGLLGDLRKFDEKGPALLERFFSEKAKIHLDRLQAVIYEVARKGNAVFFGRGSQLMLRSFDCALHALVTGSIAKRVERLMEEKKMAREVAEKIVTRSDHDKRGFLRYAFDEDWLNPQLYDLLLNTDKLSVDSAAAIIVDAARSDEIKACGLNSVRALGNLSLHRKIEAAFLEAGLVNPNLFITVEDAGSVRLYGIVDSPDEKERVGKVAKGIREITSIKNDLTVLKGAF